MACFKNLRITPDAIALLRGTEMFEALDKRDNTVGIINVDADIAERQNAKTIAVDGVSPSRAPQRCSTASTNSGSSPSRVGKNSMKKGLSTREI
jgi:hypothetical protein